MATLTEAQKTTIRRLAAEYTKACNTGTGRQALAAENRLNSYLDKVSHLGIKA